MLSYLGLKIHPSWIGDVLDVFLPREEENGRVDVAQVGHSPGREDRIPDGTKVLHVFSTNLSSFLSLMCMSFIIITNDFLSFFPKTCCLL